MNAFKLWVLAALALLTGCSGVPTGTSGVASIHLQSTVRDMAPASPRWQIAEPEAAGVRVWRNFVPVSPSRGMQLEPGDVVQTAAGTAATIVFSGGAGGGTAVLDESTRVRVGSLEVFFGRIFANVRGLFETTSQNVVAGVEGTQFLFEVGRDRAVHVGVVQGVVACRTKDGSWSAVRLAAGQSLRSAYPNRSPPQVGQADPRELRDAAAWAAAVSSAGEAEQPAYREPQINFGIGIGGRGGDARGEPRPKSQPDPATGNKPQQLQPRGKY
jgi:hypothetical protein